MSLTFVLGRCDSLRSEVFLCATVPEGANPADAIITGTLRGPECRGAITLPVTAKFSKIPADAKQAPAMTIVARAILTEPSYWTPELPNLYQLDARLVVNGHEADVCQRLVGLRRFGVRGRSLWLDGRRYVPRGLAIPEAAIDVEQFRAAGLAAVVADPSETFLDRCDVTGVPVIGRLADGHDPPLEPGAAAERMVSWAWHPSVLLAVVPAGMGLDGTSRLAAAVGNSMGTLLLAAEVDGSVPPSRARPDAELLVVTLGEHALPHEAWQHDAIPVPLVALRGTASDVAISRNPCDSLQADLASWRSGGASWDWAGFCVDVGSQGTRSGGDAGSIIGHGCF